MARATPKISKQRVVSTARQPAREARPTRSSPALRRLLSKPEKNDLRWWFDVGRELLQSTVEKAGRNRDRTEIVRDLARQLRNESLQNATTTLRQARRLALRFTTWKELEKFQGDLRIWHVMSLVAVDEKKGSTKSMQEFRDACVAEDWSVRRLKGEIQNDKGDKKVAGRRPKPMGAATAAIAVKNLLIAARGWTTFHECLAGEKSVLRQARRADYSPNLRRDVQKAIQALRNVREAVRDELQQLRHLLKNIEAALKE